MSIEVFPEDRKQLLGRLGEGLLCPDCEVAFCQRETDEDLFYECPSCGTEATPKQDQWVFGGFTQGEVESDWLNKIKEQFKWRLGHCYPLAKQLLSPVYSSGFVRDFLRTLNADEELIADLGCGTKRYKQSVVCIDGVGYPNVHIVADLERLPLRDESFDGMISIAVLEHTLRPQDHVREMMRVLRPGGRVLCYIPFIQGFHASPQDYQRYTVSGIRELFREFEIIQVCPGGGPTSGMLWVLQEWLSMICSFGSERFYRLLLPLTWILSPLKYLDCLLVHHPAAHVIASGLFIEARKPFSGKQDSG